MQNPKFSILIPAKDRVSFLREAIQAIPNQTYEDYEVIIKDGSNNDNFEQLRDLIQGDSRFIYLHSQDNSISRAMNIALSRSTGDILNWANDDDLLLPNALKDVVWSIGDYKWLYGKIQCVNEKMEPIGEMGESFNFERMLAVTIVPQPAVFWTREAFEKVGMFDEELCYAQDFDYWVRLAKNWEPKYIPIYLTLYRIHSGQETLKHLKNQRDEHDRIVSKYKI